MNEALAQALASIIAYLGPTPILLTIVLLGLGPWGTLVWVIVKLTRLIGKISKEQAERMQSVFDRQDVRYEEAIRNYDNNALLVRTTQDLAKALRETVAYNTEVMTSVKDAVEHNQFCPWERQKMRIQSGGGQ